MMNADDRTPLPELATPMQNLLHTTRRVTTPPPVFADEITRPELVGEPAAIELTVGDWDEVEELCARREHGLVYINVATPHREAGCPITLTLLLPNGFTVTLAGEVVTTGETAARRPTIALVGLTRALAAQLRALAGAGRTPAPQRREDPHHTDATGRAPALRSAEPERWLPAELARGTTDMKVSDLLLSNQALRAQIEALARKMRPR
jgi:hypothetical protein